MKIAINTRHLIKNQIDGIGQFTLESFKRIIAQNPDIEFTFIFDRKPHPDFTFANNHKVLLPQARHPLLYKIWYQQSLKRYLNKNNFDLFVATDGMIPLNTNTKCLSVIHDLNFEHFPEYLPKRWSNYYKYYFSKFAQDSNRIATVSNYSKTDIVNTYNINKDKIDVVYNGYNTKFKPLDSNQKKSTKEKYTEGANYFLFIGTLHPRKNLSNLFIAFNKFKQTHKSDIKLVVAGKKMWWTKEIENTYNRLQYKNEIVFTGRLPQNELCNLTGAAFALTYIPFFEGFGIPLVEAMGCNIPIITSNTTSMPEVVENAAILCNPNNPQHITDALATMYKDKALRASLIEKGKNQLDKFSWDKTSNLLWESMLKTIKL